MRSSHSFRAVGVLVSAACLASFLVACGAGSEEGEDDPPAACTFRMSGSLDFNWCEIYQGDFSPQTPAEFCSGLAYNTGAFEDVTCESLGYTVTCSSNIWSKPGYTCP